MRHGASVIRVTLRYEYIACIRALSGKPPRCGQPMPAHDVRAAAKRVAVLRLAKPAAEPDDAAQKRHFSLEFERLGHAAHGLLAHCTLVGPSAVRTCTPSLLTLRGLAFSNTLIAIEPLSEVSTVFAKPT